MGKRSKYFFGGFCLVLCGLFLFYIATASAESAGYEDAYNSGFGAGALIGITTYGADLGIHWSRLPVDVSANNYTGINADPQIKEYQDAGIVAFGVINPTAGMQDESFPTSEQFAQGVTRLVERYDGDGTGDMDGLTFPVKVWELINEYSSNGMSMQYPASFDQDTYISMMQQGYQAMKQACPDCLLAFDPFNDDDVTALLGDFSADNIDIIAFHSYSPLDYAKDPSVDLYVGNIDSRLAKFGLTGKPVWVTEYAFYDHEGADRASATFPGSQTDNARWFVQTTGWGLGSGTFEKIIYTEIEPPMDAQTDQALSWMSLVDESGGKKPIYYAFQKMIDMIDLFDSKETLSLGTDIYGYKFKKGSKAIYLIWSGETTGTHTVTLSDIQAASAIITEAVPDDSGNFSAATETIADGTLTRSIDETPVYIEVEETETGNPVIDATPAAVAFGSVQVGSSSQPVPVVVANTGTADLDISGITITGDNDSSFSVAGDNCSGHTIPNDSSCAMTIVFSPATAGQHNAYLVVSSNDPETPALEIPLSGQAVTAGADNDSDNASICPAAALLGRDDPRLQTLRNFRDTVLSRSAFGKSLIKTYYATGEDVLDFIEKHPLLKRATITSLKLLPAIVKKQ